MELRSPDRPERTPEESFEMVAAAGYDGMCIDPAANEIGEFRKLGPLYEQFELGCMVNAFPGTVDDLRPLLELAVEMEASLVNVIGGVMPLTVDDGIPVIRHWMAKPLQGISS